MYEQAQQYVDLKEREMENDAYVENIEINADISHEEISAVILKLKNNKSCGIDGIPNEILKQEGIFPLLISFINMCFKHSLIPTLWTQSIIKPIPKSSTKDPCIPLNYRGISLLSCVSKILSGILNNRLCMYYDAHEIMCDEQNGFRRKRSCEEHVFSLTSIIRNRIGKGLSTFVAFIDLEKAFDRVDRNLLLYRLLLHNIDGKIFKIIKKMYTSTKSCLQLNNLFTDWFDVNSGVRQGDNLSPTLFGYLINSLALCIKSLGKGIKLGNDTISILLYADDMVLTAENEADLQGMLNAMYEWSIHWRLKVNISKSKIMQFRPSRRKPSNNNFKYGGNMLERVSDYKYLGIYLDEYLNYNKCSKILSESAGRALGGVIAKFKTLKDCGYKTYTKLFETGVLSILHYGAEIWGFGNYPKCDNIINRAMRFFLGVHRFAPTAGVQGDMGWMSLKYRRYIIMLKFWNRLIQMDESRLTKRIFLWFFEHPENNWCSDIKDIAIELDLLHVYTSKTVFDTNIIYEKCFEIMSREWRNNISDKPKLRTYREIKHNFGAEPYVLNYVPKHVRSIFAQLRIGVLPLRIETGRFTNIIDQHTGLLRKMNVDERTCNICNLNIVEDEYHFLLSCCKYNNERRILYELCKLSKPNFETLTQKEKLTYLMNTSWKLTTQYVYNIWLNRKNLESV